MTRIPAPVHAPTDPKAAAARIVHGLECDRPGCPCHWAARRGYGLTHCPCPGHTNGDQSPSLSITVGDKDALWKCHANCSGSQVTDVLRERGLWGSNGSQPPQVVASEPKKERGEYLRSITYEIRNVDGTLLAYHERKEYEYDKTFAWRHPDGRVSKNSEIRSDDKLYGLELLKGHPDWPVVLTEGEKAADALRAALGDTAAVLATVGASTTPDKEVLAHLAGRPVFLWPDADQPGRKHMDRIAAALADIAAEVKVIDWPQAPDKGDAADFLEQHTNLEAITLLQRAKRWEADAPPSDLPWTTAAKLAAETPVEVPWAWRDYLALGTVVELDAKMKAGKSTFIGHLLRALLDGRSFLGRATMSGPVIYLTEEGDRTFNALVTRARLTDCDDLHILSRRKVARLEWDDLVAAARLKLIETGAVVMVVDTLAKVAGFKDDDENSSGRAMAAMAPLQALATEMGIVVIVVRHDRKAGGEVGDSARGSSAFGGDADVILQLSRVGGKGRESQRCLRSIGRFDETPPEITIELTDDGYREVTSNDARDAAAKAVLGALPTDEDEATAVVDLLPELKEAGHSRTQVYNAVDHLVAEGHVLQAKRKGPTGHMRLVAWKTSSNGGT